MKLSISLPTGFEAVMYPIPFVEPADFVRMAQLCERRGGAVSLVGPQAFRPAHASQFSTFKPRTRLNSPSLAVTIVAAIACAWAAISRSLP